MSSSGFRDRKIGTSVMGCVQEKIKTAGLVSASVQTNLLEEMRILREMHDQAGTRKAINSELWHACAGPLVSLPQIGSLVYYFPQGHIEQVAVSTRRPATTQVPNYPNLPSQLMCQVHNVTLHADKDTDEIYAQMSLQPVHSEKDVFPVPDFGIRSSKHPSEFFCKTLTASDTSTHGGFSVPRRAAEKLFPPLDYTAQPPTQELVVRDLHDNTWTFRHIYRGQPKRHLLTTGWSLFVGSKRLKAGDSVLFIRDEKSQLLVGVRRANRHQTALPSSVLSADSMHIGVLAAAAHAAANRTQFTIFYNPRACPSEFVIPIAKYRKAVCGTQLSVGMRFGMMFETEESAKRRYMGTIVGISDLDPLRWPGSKWQNLQVEWDEPGCNDKPTRVSAWEVETPESLFIFPSFAPGLKRPLHPGLFPAENGWSSLVKRPLLQVPEAINPIFPYSSFTNSCSEQLVKMMRNSLANGALMGETKMTQVTTIENPELAKFESKEAANESYSQPGMSQPGAMNSNSLNDGVCMNQHAPTSERQKLEPESSTDQNGKKGATVQECNNTSSQDRMNQLNQEPNLLMGQQTQAPTSDFVTTGLSPFLEPAEPVPNLSSFQSLARSDRSPGSSLAFGTQDFSGVLSEPFNAALGQEIWDYQTNNLRFLSQPDLCIPFMNQEPYSLDAAGLGDISTSNGGSTVLDQCASTTVLDEFCAFKEAEFQNPSDCLVGNLSSCQDVQSQLTSASFADSQAVSRQDFKDNSCGASSSNVDFDESSLLQNSSWQQAPPPPPPPHRVRTYTKVQKAGSVGRSIDVTSFRNYKELRSAIECMFGLEGLLNDPKGSGWKLVYVDYENDVLLVGDDPWEEFVGCVRCIRILSPAEVQQMSEEGMKLLNSAAMQGI